MDLEEFKRLKKKYSEEKIRAEENLKSLKEQENALKEKLHKYYPDVEEFTEEWVDEEILKVDILIKENMSKLEEIEKEMEENHV